MKRRPPDPSLDVGGIPTPSGLPQPTLTSDINMTPMIDVMMSLLIIFMVVTPVITAYNAQLPRASNVAPETEDEVIELGIDRQGRFWVGESVVAGADLSDYLLQTFAARPGDHLLYLRADRTVPYSLVLDVVAAAREAGVRRIGAITEPVVTEGDDEAATASSDGTVGAGP